MAVGDAGAVGDVDDDGGGGGEGEGEEDRPGDDCCDNGCGDWDGDAGNGLGARPLGVGSGTAASGDGDGLAAPGNMASVGPPWCILGERGVAATGEAGGLAGA